MGKTHESVRRKTSLESKIEKEWHPIRQHGFSLQQNCTHYIFLRWMNEPIKDYSWFSKLGLLYLYDNKTLHL